MTKTCVVCKKQPIPYDRSRSFHKFPDNLVLKDKWISALKISCNITKNSRICSDHFTPESFHETSGYTFLRKLLPEAVPSLVLKRKDLSDITNRIVTNVNDSVIEIKDCVNTSGAIKRKSPETDIEHLHHSAAKKVNIQDVSGQRDECHGTVDACHNEQLIKLVRSGSDTASAKDTRLQRKRSNIKGETCNRRNNVRFRIGFKTKYICRTDFTTDEAWNRFLEFTSYKNAQIKASQKRNLRKKNKIKNFKDLVQTLKKKETSAVADYLQDLPENIKQLLTRMKEKKRTAPFPSHLKTFARTLHFYSPAAYQMVRNTFLKCLPCVETLNSWNCSKNYKPGICEEIIEYVSELVKNENKIGKTSIFNVTFDEMSIKKWAYYCKNSHEWKGLVDLGGQLEETERNVKASKALVFMLVNMNGGFKTPVAYYLTNSLSGSDKSILLKDLLTILHKKDIKVVSVTFDGDESNQSACKLLGANFNCTDKQNFKPFFKHPASSEQVYVFFDPCHMLKLVRNYFAIKGPIIYDNSQYIDWSYIKKLNEKQYEEELHCACKIKNRHVNFYNEKMKVFLAAQVLSSSTAIALNFLEHELNDANFKNSSATSTFCLTFNDIFDILNTKNKFCKSPNRKCLTENNLSELKSKIDEYINYIEKLEINVPVKINSKANRLKMNTCINKENEPNNSNDQYKTVRKFVLEAKSVRTGFTGFVICLKNLYSLCENLFENKIVDYFLSYKISQDHVEMFFALIRRMNGYTNNPTTIQFQSAFKKLLLNNINVTVPASANCTPQDNTLIISHSNEINSCDNKDLNESNHENKCKRYHTTKKSYVEKEAFPIGHFLHNNAIIFEHDYSRNEGWAESEYLDQIIKHTAGSVVYSIKKIIHCKNCLNMLYSSNVSSKSRLTELKNRGGLQFASDDINLICFCAEKVLRKFKDSLLAKNIYFTVVSETLKMLPSSVLDFNNHVLDQDPLYDHRQQLIYLIVQNYIDKRLKHESNKLGDLKYRTRMYYNKLTIFKGE